MTAALHPYEWVILRRSKVKVTVTSMSLKILKEATSPHLGERVEPANSTWRPKGVATPSESHTSTDVVI